MKPESSRIDKTKSTAERVVHEASEAIRKAQLPIMDAGLRVTCTDLRELVEIRLNEARVLAGAGCASGACLLAADAVAVALKVCFAEWVTRCVTSKPTMACFPETTDLPTLVGMAQLSVALRVKYDADNEFRRSWNRLLTWSERCRNGTNIPHTHAIAVVDFASDPEAGAVQWVKQYWEVQR